MTQSFKTIPNRDASATIQGFLYQIEQTILHWLRLADDEVLELECGEDLDIVRKAFLDEDSYRMLGQIKLRTAAISLHNSDVVEALVNFSRHRRNNPDHKLQFRFITTAKPTVERKRNEGQQTPGLLLWSAISNNTGLIPISETEIQQIRSLMLKSTRPSKVARQDWDAFKALWASGDHEVLPFVSAVSWSLSTGGIDQLVAEIESALSGSLGVLQHAVSDAHMRLVFYVLNRLSTGGEKRLTRMELMSEVARSENLAVNPVLLQVVRDALLDREQLSRIEAGLSAITEKLSKVEIGSQLHDVQVAPSVPQVTKNEIPPLVVGASRRASNVDRLLEVLKQVAWLHLIGSSGSGKTHLAALVAARLAHPVWIDLRTTSLEQARKVLDSWLAVNQALTTDCATIPAATDPQKSPEDTVFLIDDLDPEGDIITTLINISRQQFGRSVRIVSISGLTPYPSPKEYLGSLYLEVRVPGFSDEELSEYCLQRGAPQSLLDRKFLAAAGLATRHHPQLISALVQFLSERSWNYDEATMKEVLRGDFAEDLAVHTQRILIRTVSEPTRNLLYRLSVIGPVVSRDDVILAGNVPPAISLPAEKLAECIGPWIQPITQSVYMLSPPVAQLAPANLSQEMSAELHRRKAASVVSLRPLNQYDARIAIQHFEAAGDYREAAELLLIALNGLKDEKARDIDDAGLTDLWAKDGFPDAIPKDLGIIIRAFQIIAKHERRSSFRNQLVELNTLAVGLVEIDPLAVFSACSMVAVRLALDVFDVALELGTIALRLESRITDQLPVLDHDLVEILWLILSSAERPEEVEHWLTVAGKLNASQIARLISCEMAASTARFVCDRLWMKEEDRPKEEQRWAALDRKIEFLENLANSARVDIIFVTLRRARIVITSTHLNDFSKAVFLAEERISRVPSRDSRSDFLFSFTLGLAARDLKKWAECELWLSQAIDRSEAGIANGYGEFVVRAYLYRSEARLQLNKQRDQDLRTAVDYARAMPEVNELLLIRALGEYAIYLWSCDDFEAFYEVWNEAVERVIGAKADSILWKELFILVGNNSAYCAYELKGVPAEMQMTKPFAGMYLIYSPRLHELYSSEVEWMMAASMIGIAERCRRFGDCGKWALRTVEMAADSQFGANASFYLLYATAEAIRKRRYVEALEFVLSSVSAIQDPDERFQEWAVKHRGEDLKTIIGNRPRVSPEINRELLAFVILGIVLDLTIWEMTDRVGVQTATDGVIDACRLLSSRSSDAEVWRQTGDCIERTFQAGSQAEIILQANRDAQEGRNLLAAIGYLASGRFQDDERTAFSWMATMRYLHQQITRSPSHYHLLSELTNRFWTLRVISSPMAFRRPATLQRRLNELAEQGHPSIRRTMRFVGEHLGLDLDRSLWDWLESDEL